MNPASAALGFVISAIFGLLATLVAIRFLMQACRADYYNPIAQTVIRLTDPLLAPLRKVLPTYRQYDTAALVLCFLVILIKFLLLKTIQSGNVFAAGYSFNLGYFSVGSLTLLSVLDTLNTFFNVFLYGMIGLALLSWIVQDPRHPLYSLLGSITAPILNPVRRIVPVMGGIDLSVMVAIIGLYALKILIFGTLVGIFFGS